MSSHPPNFKSREELEEARKNFIKGEAYKNTDKPVEAEILPWDAPFVRADVKKLFSLRFTEPDMLKLQYIHQQTGKSMHQFCMDILLPAIEDKIKEITEKK